MSLLDDGVYEVVVVDAQEIDEIGALSLELVVTTGTHKGDVVPLRVDNFDRDALSLLGLPGRLCVHDGVPTFDLS
jgi:hypothetical protein